MPGKEGMEGLKTEAGGQERERSSLAVLDQKFAPAEIDEPTFLPGSAHADALMLPRAEGKIRNSMIPEAVKIDGPKRDWEDPSRVISCDFAGCLSFVFRNSVLF
ncbi:MAG: hypothetical protein ACRD5R_04900 [Candidatus Acidiferrales bacterium]